MSKIIKKGGKIVVRAKVRKRPDWAKTQEIETRTGTTDQGGIDGESQHFVVKDRTGKTRDAAWYIQKLENRPEVRVARVEAIRRQVKGGGRPVVNAKCRLVKKKVDGKWRLELRGGITGKEWLDADWHSGDCFYRLRLNGWVVHNGKLRDDPRWDFFWIPGIEMTKALTELGWV